ncbi:MAG TPA: GDSL-type esterase/lipase family protein [Candidatus Methylacidiphilales bacterium]|nr:GDSL-type esterase/lipase family protein [Candidatus Methylacidiphilales bacterium]
MKQWIIAVGAVWFGVAAAAQTNSSSTPPNLTNADAPPPSMPAQLESATIPDNTRYLNDPSLLVGCKARLAAIQGQPCDIVFIGDSITERWLTVGKTTWDQFYAPHHALNLGVRGDTTENVLWRLTNMDLQSLNPKVAVILIGTNNYANEPKEIAAGVEGVISLTQNVLPGTKIILVSILPNRRANGKMVQADAILKTLADNSTVYYLDLIPLMPPATDSSGEKTEPNWKGLGKDGLHPDASGYALWANAMQPLLTKLLGGK